MDQQQQQPPPSQQQQMSQAQQQQMSQQEMSQAQKEMSQQQAMPMSQQQVSQQQVPEEQAGASQAQQPIALGQSQQAPVPRAPVTVRRPRAIIFDILGTASKSGFLEKILFPYLQANLNPFIAQHWRQKSFVRLYGQIVQQSSEFNRQDPNVPIVLPHDSNGARQSLMSFITYITDNGINSSAITRLRFMVWFAGYQLNKLSTPIYSDIADRMRHWFAEGIKFYVFSNAWVDAQKELLRNTNHGDLTNLISGFYDNDFGLLTDSDSYKRLCTDIKINPSEVVFLTKSPVEGRAAMEAGLSVVLVLTHRHNVKAVSQEDRRLFPYVRTLRDLTWLEGSMNPASSEMPISQRSTRMQRSALSRAQISQAPSTNPVPTAISMPGSTGNLVSSQPTSGVSTASQATRGTHSATAMAALGSMANKTRRPSSTASSNQVSSHAPSSQQQQQSSTRTRTGGASMAPASRTRTHQSGATSAQAKQSSAASSAQASSASSQTSRRNSTSHK